MILLSPSLKPFSPAAAIRSTHLDAYFRPLPSFSDHSSYKESPKLKNSDECRFSGEDSDVCNPSFVHIALTLDIIYLRGSIVAVNSILQHSLCPENIFFHFLVSDITLETLIRSVFPTLNIEIYYFAPETVQGLISSSVRRALEQPLNYARNYLTGLLNSCVNRIIYLDSDLVVVDDIVKLWKTGLGPRTIGAPEYCHANFTSYFNRNFWTDDRFNSTFKGRKPCYFNTGVMVIDLKKWRKFEYTKKIEKWMEIQKMERIYEPWSGSGKPWSRLDSKHPCPLDTLWEPYDLYKHSH